MADFDTIVVGAGVVGIAAAQALAASGRDVLVLERHAGFGQEISSRNSEVLHAGIYYPAGSLKARLCVAGRRLAADFVARAGVGHKICGKLIVAVDESERAALEALGGRARANGVDDLTWLEAAEVARLEPAVRAVAGLLSPSSGIVDCHGLMLALVGAAEADGASFAWRAPVVGGGVCDGGGFSVRVAGADSGDATHGATVVSARELVVAAGFGAAGVIAGIAGVPESVARPLRYARGHYFRLAGRSPFARLVYPLPVAGGLGTHATIDLGGQARFGPDVQWIDGIDYSFDESRAGAFYESIRRWYPAITPDRLVPDYTGIRPKLVGPGEADADFAIEGPHAHGVDGLVTLQGIESPGLTSAMAIGRAVRDLLDGADAAA